jgi:hypothetical protein
MMSETTNLDSAFSIGEVDDAELKWVLSLHFRNSLCASSSKEVQFCRGGEPWAVKLIYNKGGKLVSAVGGPGLKPEDVTVLTDKVRRELMETSGPVASRCILLSSYRVTGSFTYGDKLRILPVPDHARKAPDLTESQVFGEHLTIEHPFIEEFPINRSINPVVQIERLERQVRKYALLLNLFLEGNVKRISRRRQRHWVHEGGEGRYEDVSSGYKYLREGYRYPGFYDIGPDVLPIGSHPLTLSSVEGVSPMGTMEYYEYFSNPRQDLNPPMRVPVLLATFFDRFESLGKSEQNRFLRSAFWFQHASNIWEESNSAAYLAIVTSIETLVPRGGGPTKGFVDFINRMVPTSEDDIGERRELYRLRSALTHGGDLFHADMEGIGGMNPKSASESYRHSIAMSLARQVLLNWLLRETGGWPMPWK